MIVTDQMQERPMLLLKRVGSYRDCSLCLSHSRFCPQDNERQEDGDINIAALHNMAERNAMDTFELAGNIPRIPGKDATQRDFERTISASLFSRENPSEDIANRRGMSLTELHKARGEAKSYLTATRAQPYPPALAA